LTRVLHKTGIDSDQDVAQAETQLDTTEAQATDLGIQRAQLEHAIALLIGKPASEFSIATNSLAGKTGGHSLRRSVAIARTPSRHRRRRAPRRGGERANRRGARGVFSDDHFERLGRL
jgi:outer membrane protein TolC